MKSFPSENLLPREGEAYLLTNFIDEISAQKLMSEIYDEVLWRDDKITMFGKTYPQARKVAWHGDPKVIYTYSGIKMVAPGWSSRLKQLTDKIHTTLGCQFNSALVNYYRDGKDHMSWHQDNEPELGDNPVIASLSLGASRDFFFKHRDGDKLGLTLHSGDLLVMQGQTQTCWKHALPKRLRVQSPRMNITWRKIL